MPNLNVWAWLAIVVAVIGAAGGGYLYIYKQGAAAEKAKQEKAFNVLKDKTDAVQDRALTTPDPNNELRKFSRPD